MSSETDTTTIVQTAQNHEDRFTHGDKLISPSGRVYTVGDVYIDADGGTRVKLRHSTDRRMYRSTSRLAQIVDEGHGSKAESSPSNSSTKNFDGGWTHVRDNT